MTPRPQSAALNPHGLDFDSFLYAPVGDDRHGGLLSVISALARVGVDPWDEAASLARLPLESAAQALCALLARLPEGSGKPADPVPVASRLVRLLPRGPRPPAPDIRGVATNRKGHRFVALAVATFFLLLMLVQMWMQHRTTTQTTPPVTPAQSASGTAIQKPPPTSP